MKRCQPNWSTCWTRPSLLGDAPASAVIEASSQDLLALLLGRPFHTPPDVTGDVAFGSSFSLAFPGP
jgi:hypothetical protein